jgi:dCMP deaminase
MMEDTILEGTYLRYRHQKWDIRFLDLAYTVSKWSRDPSTKVGAVIVRPDMSVASLGFNGFPKGMTDHDHLYANRDEKYSRIIHGEINALVHAREPVYGYSLYTVPFMPCDRCFVQMAQAGITRFIAPIASQESLSRWGTAFDKVRQYAREMALELVEIDYTKPDENQGLTKGIVTS